MGAVIGGVEPVNRGYSRSRVCVEESAGLAADHSKPQPTTRGGDWVRGFEDERRFIPTAQRAGRLFPRDARRGSVGSVDRRWAVQDHFGGGPSGDRAEHHILRRVAQRKPARQRGFPPPGDMETDLRTECVGRLVMLFPIG